MLKRARSLTSLTLNLFTYLLTNLLTGIWRVAWFYALVDLLYCFISASVCLYCV